MQKYTLMMLPMVSPSFQVSGSAQSGHQRWGASGPAACGRGALSRITSAKASSGTPHAARLPRQDSFTSGKISGTVSATGRDSPTSNPFV